MDPMTKLLNRISEARLNGHTGLGVSTPDPNAPAHTRAEYVDRLLAEAVAVQVENQTDDEAPHTDDELQERIDELRGARDVSGVTAYTLACELAAWITLSGYCDPCDLPTYEPRGASHLTPGQD